MPGEAPKQLRMLGGKPVLAYSLTAFEDCPRVTDIVVVTAPELVAETERVAQQAGISKLRDVVIGGATRSDSSAAAVAAAPSGGQILIHDAARPLVSQETIAAVIDALAGDVAVGVAIPAIDTIVSASDGLIETVPDRASLWLMQTPQGFDVATIRRAYGLAQADPNFEATDDCGVVRRYLPETNVRLVHGSPNNIKITHEADLALAAALLDA